MPEKDSTFFKFFLIIKKKIIVKSTNVPTKIHSLAANIWSIIKIYFQNVYQHRICNIYDYEDIFIIKLSYIQKKNIN